MLHALLPKGPVVLGFFWLNHLWIWVMPQQAKKQFRCRDMDLHKRCLMSCHWNPTKNEIEEWLDRKIHKFTVQENRNPWVSKEEWLERYLYMKIHKIFFASFPSELCEKLADNQGRCRLDKPIGWTLELVHRLEASEDKIVRTVDNWLDQIIGGFITEFVVDMTVSYSEAERHFLKGPRGKYIKFLNTWIKMLLCDKRVMRIH